MKQVLPALFLFALVACGGESALSPANSELPDRIVYRTQGYYNAAVAAEIAYAKLPACGKPTSPPLCSDLAV